MSTDLRYITIQLKGPLQSWGYNSQFSYRNTSLFPTKSAIAGIICASLGYDRGSEEEKAFLLAFKDCGIITIDLNSNKKTKYTMQRITDFHTVLGTAKVGGKINQHAHLTYRQYITDGHYGVIVGGVTDMINTIEKSLKDPLWGIWLGRKSCVPSLPLYVSNNDSLQKALHSLIGENSIDDYNHQEETQDFEKSNETYNDQVISFRSSNRMFSPRGVIMKSKKETSLK